MERLNLMSNSKRVYAKLLLSGPIGLENSLVDMREDLQLRNWENLVITWDQERNGLIIETQIDDPEVEVIAIFLQEELIEAASGVLPGFEDIHVRIIDAYLLPLEPPQRLD
jgi:hypothetical protein